MIDAVRRLALAIIESNGLEWWPEDDVYAMRFSSAMLLIGFTAVGHQTVITLRAPVLRELPVDLESDHLLRRLNELNCSSHFGKWAYYKGQDLIVLEYDLLGDHLQENELMTALTAVARLADQQDDMLQQEFGGLRSFESP